jgi:hypothetical protein
VTAIMARSYCRHAQRTAPPSKALVKGLARELDLSEAYLDKLAEEFARIWGEMTALDVVKLAGAIIVS